MSDEIRNHAVTAHLRRLLISKLTQADMRLAAKGQSNNHRQALWFERVPDETLTPEDFIAAVRRNFLKDFSPAAFVVKAWDAYKSTGKVAKITDKGGTRC
jgi:hypothetical protein